MFSKIVSGAVLSGLLLVVSAPVSFAADAPKTEAACKKATGMKWDAETKTCIKK